MLCGVLIPTLARLSNVVYKKIRKRQNGSSSNNITYTVSIKMNNAIVTLTDNDSTLWKCS